MCTSSPGDSNVQSGIEKHGLVLTRCELLMQGHRAQMIVTVTGMHNLFGQDYTFITNLEDNLSF